MKNKLYVSIGLFALVFVGAMSARGQQAQSDLSMRAALYFTGAKVDKIDLAKDKYVAKDGTMELTKSQATTCDSNYCEFNIGFIGFREGSVAGSLSTYGLFEVDNGTMVGNTLYFASREKIKQGIHAVKLKMGMNKVTFTIDPYKKTNETDENNNSFSANFKVVPDGLPLNKRGIIPKN